MPEECAGELKEAGLKRAMRAKRPGRNGPIGMRRNAPVRGKGEHRSVGRRVTNGESEWYGLGSGTARSQTGDQRSHPGSLVERRRDEVALPVALHEPEVETKRDAGSVGAGQRAWAVPAEGPRSHGVAMANVDDDVRERFQPRAQRRDGSALRVIQQVDHFVGAAQIQGSAVLGDASYESIPPAAVAHIHDAPPGGEDGAIAVLA